MKRPNTGHSRKSANAPFKRAYARLIALSSTFLVPSIATAQENAATQIEVFGIPLKALELTQFALLSGSMVAALASAFWLIRERGRIASQNITLRAKVSTLTSRVNQLEALATAEGQMAIIWASGEAKPVIVGELEAGSGAPSVRAQILAFGRWLEPSSAVRIEHAVDQLRQNAVAFTETVTTTTGVPIEMIGCTSGSSAIVRLSNLSSERAAHAKLTFAHERVVESVETLQALMDSVNMPIWLRDKNDNLSWVNKAYVDAVDGVDSATTVERRNELFGGQALKQIAEARAATGTFANQLTTVVAGDRLVFDVIEASGPAGSAGFGFDRTETETVRHELNKTIRSHEETLDELTTAVAMFDDGEKLRFHNHAFAKLWSLEPSFLEQVPDISMFLDKLRTEGQLPEQPEWRRWKDDLLSAFRATEPQEHWWHLTDGRTIRVVANPLPKGGLTWVFENLTERIDLESRYKTMVRVQGETLDHLAEGVAVFGSDGKLKLANPAFETFWDLSITEDVGSLHISEIATKVGEQGGDKETWDEFTGIVTAFDEDRTEGAGKINTHEQTLSWMIAPLPNGQTMITFVDVSASEQIERALRDRNDALERTALVRDRFIQHVSYELRSPLTTIMGFTDLLAMENIGSLNDKQREYIGHIDTSSKTLLATTDNILDLASVDAGVLELNFEKIDIEETMREAAANMEERFSEHKIDLAVRIAPETGTIVADKMRIIQIMENVLANAADFAPENSTVTFTCERKDRGVVFKVRDKGPGIDADILKDIFDRFQTHAGGRRRGAGLGLAIVKSFVDLHEGEVSIDSSPERGTEVSLMLPDLPSHVSVAAQ